MIFRSLPSFQKRRATILADGAQLPIVGMLRVVCEDSCEF
jgi:hypothetical protein